MTTKVVTTPDVWSVLITAVFRTPAVREESGAVGRGDAGTRHGRGGRLQLA